MTQAPEQAVNMLVATTCLPKWTALRGSGYYDLAQFLDDARHDDNDGGFEGGVTITPSRLFMHSIRDKLPVKSNREFGRPIIGGVEQAGPTGLITGAKEAWQASEARHSIGRLTALAGRLVLTAESVSDMPKRPRSLTNIERISELFGGLPALVDGARRHNGQLVDFSGLHFNGTYTLLPPEVCKASFGGEHYRNFHDSLHARGIDGVVISTHRMTRSALAIPQYQLDIDATFEGIRREGTLIGGIHVEAGRVDTRHQAVRARSINEAAALLSGDPDSFAKSQTAELIARAYNIYTAQRSELAAWQASRTPASRLPVTIKIPYAGLTVYKGRRLSLQDTAAALGSAAGTVRAYVGTLA